jgi:hypothetical protein
MIQTALLLLVLALLGAPLFALIASSALLGFRREDVDLSVVAIEIYRLAEMPALVAIPLFTFAGYVLGESRAPDRLVRLTHVLLGGLPGGLAVVSLVTCALFTAFTGASGVTIVALGALLYPALLGAGYPERFSLGLVTTSGSRSRCESTRSLRPACFRGCSWWSPYRRGACGRAAARARRGPAPRGPRRGQRCASRSGRSPCPSWSSAASTEVRSPCRRPPP